MPVTYMRPNYFVNSQLLLQLQMSKLGSGGLTLEMSCRALEQALPNKSLAQ